MSRFYEVLKRLGTRLGDWNDRTQSHRWLWKPLDRIAIWLYELGDKS